MGKDYKRFAKLDALHGYYQIPLAPESQKLTVFVMPQGRFYYLVAPMGINPSGDWRCRKSDRAVAGFPRVLKLVDDILVHAPSLVELRGGYEVSCSAAAPMTSSSARRCLRSAATSILRVTT